MRQLGMCFKLVLLFGLSKFSDACDLGDTVWQSWSPCSRTCGGGNQRRHGDSCLFGIDDSQTRKCNERCMYNHPFFGDICRCPSWRTGICCETCVHININYCIGDNKECGGRPDNIRCTKCRDSYYSGGYGGGCKLQTIVMNIPPNNEVNIRENTETMFVCKTSGIPEAIIRWYKDQRTINTTDDVEMTMFANTKSTTINGMIYVTSTLRISPEKGDHGTKIYCTAMNSANILISSNKTLLHVLYPAKLQKLHEENVEAGSQLNFSCPYENGYPRKTLIKWTRNGDNKRWNNQILFIENVTKHDDMIYTCTVKNIMKQTAAILEIGEESESFHLNVLYMASITSFIVNGTIDSPSVTVNENDNVSFVCTVDSNPSSIIEMKFQNQTLKKQNNAESLYFNLDAASCLDAGVYTCSARNPYNTDKHSDRELTLFVRCYPRPLYVPEANVTIALGGYATFHFIWIAYPTPSFTWEKEENNVWKILPNSTDILISISDVDACLTISNISLDSYGKYQLKIKNDIDEFIQHFYLVAEDEQHYRERVIKNESELIGGIIGGVLFCIVVIVTISLFYYRKYGFKCKGPLMKTPKQPDKREQPQSYVDMHPSHYVDTNPVYDTIEQHTAESTVDSKDKPYTKLDQEDGYDKQNIYSKMEHKSTKDDKEKKYVNLDVRPL